MCNYPRRCLILLRFSCVGNFRSKYLILLGNQTIVLFCCLLVRVQVMCNYCCNPLISLRNHSIV